MSKAIAADDFAKLKVITDLDLSPDGRTVVFSARRADVKKRKYWSDLWWSRDSGYAVRITFGDRNDISPKFSPDGAKVAFLSNREDEKAFRFHLLPADGGEARPVGPALKGEVGRFSFSPDGGYIYYSFRAADEPTKGPEGKPEAPPFREVNRIFYRLDGEGWRPKDSFDVYRLDIGPGTVKKLTDDKFENADFALSADGKDLYYLSCHREDPDRDADYVDLFRLPAKGGKAKKLTTPVGPKGALSADPAGKYLAWFGHEHPEDPAGRSPRLYLHDLASGKTVNLTGTLDHVGGGVIDDLNGICADDYPQFTPDGKSVLFNLSREGCTGVWEMNTDGKGKPREVVGGLGAATFFRVHERGLFYAWVTAQNPGELYHLERGGEPRRLSSLNTRVVGAWHLPEPERFRFKSGDGTELQGWLLTPPGFNPKSKYPAVIEVHGGPHVSYGEALMHEFHYLAGRGFVVLWCNPRGSTSYGEKFTRAIVDAWGTKDYEDVLALADHAAGLPFVDAAHIGITGGSYGGYMTNWVIGHTDRFAAAVTQRSVYNLLDFYGASDTGFWFEKEFGGKRPWSDRDHYWKLSPIAYIGNAKTPTLVIHSEGDLRCPVSQGEQVFVALKTLGVPTKFIRFPEEFHGLSRGGRADRRVKRLQSIADWFDEYLLGKGAK
jgi:dipeptidyl aminopeptidase/acylaminoacyl peptidase